jgi:hypothetical protein
MCAGAQTASVARIKAERSRKLARRTSWRSIQQRDGEHGPKAGKLEHQSPRSRVRAARQAAAGRGLVTNDLQGHVVAGWIIAQQQRESGLRAGNVCRNPCRSCIFATPQLKRE